MVKEVATGDQDGKCGPPPGVHDLLRIDSFSVLQAASALPDWVKRALDRAPYVVVRRAPAARALIAIGVRGTARSERFAAFVGRNDCSAPIRPESLVRAAENISADRRANIPALAAVPLFAAMASEAGITWGPTGSVGFELATGVPTAHPDSDLDGVIRLPSRLCREVVEGLHMALKRMPCRLDFLLETPRGAVAFEEYASGKTPFLLRRSGGAVLFSDFESLWPS